MLRSIDHLLILFRGVFLAHLKGQMRQENRLALGSQSACYDYALITFGLFTGNLPRVSTINLACSVIMA